MKCTIWTKQNSKAANFENDDWRARCISICEIATIPAIGTGIIVRNNFCVERIEDVYYDVENNSVEIHLETIDENFEYGQCQLRFHKG